MTRRAIAAIAVATLAFSIYRATMLAGVELGDSASFQVMVGSPVITPRDGYPLYFAIGNLIHLASGASPARALNLASAIEGAIACGLVALVAIRLSGATLAGAAAALMFAGSYTFWSQSIIAEVYALHALSIALTLLLLLRWEEQPSIGRLLAFFVVYAVSFGNHLTTILLAPAYLYFLVASAPGGWRSMLSMRVILLATVSAASGAALYAWNFSALWHDLTPPRTWLDALRTFWFDVTKADWRDTMILRVPAQMAIERLRMYAFDVTQQFGTFGLSLALFGLVGLARSNRRQAALVVMSYVLTVVFALAYNVGDSHVFFLPSHLMLAVLTASGLVYVGSLIASQPAAVAIALVMIAARIYRDYPALDRSQDRRPTEVLAALTADLDDRHAILIADLNWQLQNGLNYFARFDRPQVAYARMPEVTPYAPALIRDNLAIGRDAVATERAKATLDAAYGPLLTSTMDGRVPARTIAAIVRELPPGARYVICHIRPSGEFVVDDGALNRSLELLAGRRIDSFARQNFAAMAGTVGKEPHLLRASDRPFWETAALDGVRVDVRMESWLPFDTIRRMGFGQVVAARNHALIIERGISFVALDPAGRPLETGYEANIFMPQRRYLITVK